MERPKVPADTPVTSSTYKNAYVQGLVKAGVPSAVATKLIDCVVPGLDSAGLKTVSDVNAHPSELRSVVQACAKKLGGV